MASTKKISRLRPRVGLICVGSELLRGKINTHASTLARRLASIGMELQSETTVSDELPLLTDAIRRATDRFDVVMVTGGLGPTFDDLTREATASAIGRRLSLSKTLLKGIAKKFYRARLRRMPPANARQAYLLDGARAIENAHGTAPGQWLEREHPRDASRGRQIIVLLPGPPSELHPMMDHDVLPRLKALFPAFPQAEAHLHFVGMAESKVDHAVRPIIERAGDSVQFTILAHLGLVDLDIFVTAKTQALAQRTVNRLVRSVRRAIGAPFYGQDEAYPLEKVVGDRFRTQGHTLALAESCTGGLLASRLTEVPGSSDYLLGAVVSYDNRIKELALDVPTETLKRHGAVSPQTAVAMAEGVRKKWQSTVGFAITGIAGPTGGTPKKPVGLVYLARSTTQGTTVQEHRYTGMRSAVRQRAVLSALDWLRQAR